MEYIWKVRVETPDVHGIKREHFSFGHCIPSKDESEIWVAGVHMATILFAEAWHDGVLISHVEYSE